jgi:hypothetical protein
MTLVVARVCAKIYADEPGVPDESVVPIFHKWIRQRALGGVLLDVADYTHVPEGPGVLLVSHDTTFSLDRSDGRFGLSAQRRRPFDGDFAVGVAATLRTLLAAADALERDAAMARKLRFDRERIRIQANDRLRLPNTEDGFAVFRPVIEAAVSRAFPATPGVVERMINDGRERLAVDVVFAEAVS